MIDHVLGRPSVKFRKYQIFSVVFFWSIYLNRGNGHGPPVLRKLSRFFTTRLTAWQTLVLTLLYLYVAKNFGKVVGLECPEPLANLYTRPYFRATWVTTALDAGFWTAMNIRPKWLKDLASMVFSVYYLVCAEQADEKVRQVRGGLTLQHLRVSWDKPLTPYINFFSRVLRPKLMRTKHQPREIRIPRPKGSSYAEPITAWMYFDGPLSDLRRHDKIVLDIPGGGFVAMTPRCHDDKLLAWAGRTGVPILALDYKKAPEHPYPYALHECYDVYHTLLETRGRCIGLSCEHSPKIIVSGDSAGGNLAVSMVLMILQSGSTDSRRWQGENSLPTPEALILAYPALDMNIGNWMTDEQMALIKDRRMRKTNEGVLRRKSDDYRKLTPNTPLASDDEDDECPPSEHSRRRSAPITDSTLVTSPTSTQPFPPASHTPSTAPIPSATDPPPVTTLRTRLAMSSMISYFNDRILTPEMMRAMIILYIGPHSRPDFSTDYLLSPVLAPDSLLAKFPRTYILTGERDPLVDDTVIFAGRVKAAKMSVWRERRELGLRTKGQEGERFEGEREVGVLLVPGISHGFLQFVSVFPEGWKYIFRCARWMQDVFAEADRREEDEDEGDVAVVEHAEDEGKGEGLNGRVQSGYFGTAGTELSARFANASPARGRDRRHHRRMRTGSSGDDDRPLEMTSIRPRGGAGVSKPNRLDTRRAVRSGRSRGHESPSDLVRNKSLVSLASSDDLLSRRMKGLTTSLMGVEDVLHTP